MGLDQIRFTKEHEWVSIEIGSDVVTIGITEFAAGELGDIVFVELPEIGKTIASMEPAGTIEAVKTVADLFAPVSGVVTEINEALEDNPGLVNESPQDAGWFMKVKISDRTQIDSLMTREEYDKLVGKE